MSEAAIATNLTDVRQRIVRAALAVGRDPATVQLVAVSKTFAAERVRIASAAGQTEFGENRVQEAVAKISKTADLSLSWHLVGHLQSNKVRKAAGAFAWIHTIDAANLVKKLDAAALDLGSTPQLLVQVDLANESTKSGVPPDRVSAIFDAAASCRAVRIRGLMVIPPFTEDPEGARPYFRQLCQLATRLRETGLDASMLGELSMGMSHDLEVAVEEGATMVRVGTAIFGSRMNMKPAATGDTRPT